MNLRSLFTGVVTAAALVLSGAVSVQANGFDDIRKAGKIRVSTDFAVPPFGMLDKDLKPTGLDTEVAKLLAADLGVEIEFIKTTGATRIPNLLTNKADVVISSLSITPDRAQVIDFSKPYGVINSVIGASKSTRISAWEDLRGKSVAVARGTINDTDISSEASKYGFTVTRYEDDATLITAIISGQSSIIGHASATLNRINERDAKLAFEPKIVTRASGLGIGVRKGEAKLVAQLNEWVDKNMQNGKLNELSVKFTGMPLPTQMPVMATR